MCGRFVRFSSVQKFADLDRMPVILAREAYGTWMDPDLADPERLKDFLKPYPCLGGRCVGYPAPPHGSERMFAAPSYVVTIASASHASTKQNVYPASGMPMPVSVTLTSTDLAVAELCGT
jgi:hypothetical protein